MNDLTSFLTILIPGNIKDVSQIKRCLRFIDSQCVRHRVIIFDWTRDNQNPDWSFIDQYNNLDIKLLDTRSLGNKYLEFVAALEAVQTEYVVILDQDDFIFSDALVEAVNFLNDNPSYIGCSSYISKIIAKRDEAGRPRTFLRAYPIYSFEQNDPEDRIVNGLVKYSTKLFSPYRTNILREVYIKSKPLIYDETNSVNNDYELFHEFYLSVAPLFFGRYKLIDENVGMFRTADQNSFSVRAHSTRNRRIFPYALLNKNFSAHLDIFYNLLSDLCPNLSSKFFIDTYEKAFIVFLRNAISGGHFSAYKDSREAQKLHELIRQGEEKKLIECSNILLGNKYEKP